jgi:hypothetical protein
MRSEDESVDEEVRKGKTMNGRSTTLYIFISAVVEDHGRSSSVGV